ncbi:hypothetical protein BGZ49_007418 [Haplosporangium sp. Z 27]|nr:hypothetical protein BGZ49_007418 [Haplosporangium sp. Z 27]
MEDNDIALALDAMTDAKDLVMKWSYFSDNSLRSLLSRHSMTIRTLVFCRYEFPTGSMVQTILSTCPSLEVVEFSSIGGIDLVKIDRVITNDANGDAAITDNIVLAKDWVCLGLKSLSINIKMSRPLYGPGQDDFIDAQQLEKQQKLEQVHAFRQLSRLEQLTKLDIKCLETLGKSLDLRLESFGGHLEKLASLKRLEIFKFERTCQQMSKDEIHWMFEHWPRLRAGNGSFDRNTARSKMLEKYFKELLDKRN